MTSPTVRVVVFCMGLGLLGPAIPALLWPPTPGSFAGSQLVAGVVILLWPLQLLAPHEQEGILILGALGLSIANAGLFAVGGLAVAVTANRRAVNGSIVAGALVFLAWARITIGFSPPESWLAIVVAAAVYALPFLLSHRMVQTA